MEENLNFNDYLTTKQFGEALKPPRTKQAICWLCNAGKIQGAVRQSVLGRPTWLIPKTALETFDVGYRNRRTRKQIEEERAKEALEKKGEETK